MKTNEASFAKTVKAQERNDEPVTEDVLQRASVAGGKRRRLTLHAMAVQYLPAIQALLISFEDQSAIALPVKNYVEFASLDQTELEQIGVGFGGVALCLEERDLHVSIAGLVSASKPLMELAATVIAARNGSRSSAAKAQAARENGRKGGRPRKLVA